jgi:uncharacterized oxidoreductase
MRPEDLRTGGTADAEATITTNLLGPIRLTAALLPQLLAQPRTAIITVSSGLGFVPMAMTPTYCATKAAIHSYTQSLRYQLTNTSVQVLELIPPYVQTELMGAGQANDPRAMPLDQFISETMNILKTTPDATETCVERVDPLRFAERNVDYEAFFKNFNDAVMAPGSSSVGQVVGARPLTKPARALDLAFRIVEGSKEFLVRFDIRPSLVRMLLAAREEKGNDC